MRNEGEQNVRENATEGFWPLPGNLPVSLTGVERHQDVLAAYDAPLGGHNEVKVELVVLAPAVGARVVEARINGLRVGELDPAMSRRYAGMLERAIASGVRPLCEARAKRGRSGIELTVLVPSDPDSRHPGADAPKPPRAPAPKPAAKSRKPLLISAGVVLALMVAMLAVNARQQSSQAGSVAPLSTTGSTAPRTTTTTATTTTTTTTFAAPVTTEELVPPVSLVVPPLGGTAAAPANDGCHPNYADACVPIADDVDCEGGSGNGPAYVRGPVRVVGDDVYDLDRDRDGIACD
ncbi:MULTISPECIES: hypothetical protein [Actinosynnema]|uniref:hypothetical protein n=1 Tax=Actinosynnema TaxID=40566 RepID=UPI0020A545B4|nr:hypothetical protein [Actinosynnema pretiosum]